ncbi:MAG TPA: hypothetical protein VGI22_25955, partial [Xanthobacteraceae bacterium]
RQVRQPGGANRASSGGIGEHLVVKVHPFIRQGHGAGPDFTPAEFALKHNPSGWNQPDGLCPVKPASPVRANPIKWNRVAVPFDRIPL